nr:hypothetical protein [uncultured Sphingomonas sp.]
MRAAALLLGVCLADPALAQRVVTSPTPAQVGVTVYRDQNRGNAPPNRNWLNGYALISETRTITIPAGETELRFEGVASGIIPQSAIIGGLPEGLIERNRDALLLSAGSLVDRALGQRVSLKRTDRATGKVTTEDAVVRSGSDGGVVLQTAAGVEALRCTGLAETLVHDHVPAGLSARPTLSVRVRARQALQATVTLSYLATGFDWQADYVAMLSRDERTLQLQAWLTLASTDDTSFVGATTQAVAGRVNREQADVPPPQSPQLRLSCWPQGTTSSGLGEEAAVQARSFDGVPPPPPPPPPPAPATMLASEIIVTGSRMTAARERLGDLQLYRIPEPVTVAANAQKQVGLLDRPAVRVQPSYRFRVNATEATSETTGELILQTTNRQGDGLGLPLPAGNLVLFAEGRARPLLLGEVPVRDTAIGEKVELALAEASGVRVRLSSSGGQARDLVLTNDRPVAAIAEVELLTNDGDRIEGARLVRRHGKQLWLVTVPANGRATLSFRVRKL